MKEASGELNMTLVTIIAIAAVLTFVVAFLPGILNSVGDKWNDAEATSCYQNGKTTPREINPYYATDKTWYQKVERYMDKLQS